MEKKEFLIKDVIDHGMCVGCGACAASAPELVEMEWTEYENFRAKLIKTDDSTVRSLSRTCPFSDLAPNEDVLAREVFGEDVPIRSQFLGNYLEVGVGRIADGVAINGSSSGGITTYILLSLLRQRAIDGVIHVASLGRADKHRIMSYRISRSAEEILHGRKSRYYSVEFSEVLGSIRDDGKRYAFVGVPCFIKAMRLLQREDSRLKAQVPFLIALVCGHMKSGAFAKSFAWQMGVQPDQLLDFDFRVKAPGLRASDYHVAAIAADKTVSGSRHSLLGCDWGHVMFRPMACDFCDDIAGELGDACFGDAWLPEYESDSRGTNIFVIRNKFIQDILRSGAKRGEITCFSATENEFVQSQAANYRHRREGLRVRLNDRRRRRVESPIKRDYLLPGVVSLARRKIYRLRVELGNLSHEHFMNARRLNDFDYFARSMEPLLKKYRHAYKLLKLFADDGFLGKFLRKLGLR